MPLSKGKSHKAFIHNIKAELAAGKPRAQSLAIAYATKRKAEHARKMAAGGEVDANGNPDSASTEGAATFQGFVNSHPDYEKAKHPPDVQQWQYNEGTKERGGKQLYLPPKKQYDQDHVAMMAEGGEVDNEYVSHIPENVDYSGEPMKESIHGGKPREIGPGEEIKYHKDLPREDPHPVVTMAEGGMVDKVMKKRGMYSKGGMVANDDEPIADSKPAQFDDLALEDELEEHETGANSGDELGNHEEAHEKLDIISKVMHSWRKKDKLPGTL